MEFKLPKYVDLINFEDFGGCKLAQILLC